MLQKMQMYLLLCCGVLYLDMVLTKSLPKRTEDAAAAAAVDLMAAASDSKSNGEYFSRGDGGDFENGYSKSTEDKGTGGYDTFEKFEKKDGDKYGYEEHEGYGNAKKDKDDDEENDFEDSYKYSHSSSYKHGDNDDGQTDAYSSQGGSGESNESGFAESESYRRSYTEDDSDENDSEDEDSDHSETRDSSIVYGKHPADSLVVKQPSALFKPSKAIVKQPSSATHHQYMVFGDSGDTSAPKKYVKKGTKHVVTPVLPAYKKPSQHHNHSARDGRSLSMDKLRGYSSYVVHNVPRDSQVGQAVSSSMVNVGASIQVAGNGNYNEASGLDDLQGYPDLHSKPKTAGGYMNTKYSHKPGYVVDDAEERTGDDSGSSEYEHRHEQRKRQKPKYVYEEDAE